MDAVLLALGALSPLGLMAATAGEIAALDRWTRTCVRPPEEPPRRPLEPVLEGAGLVVHG